MTKKTSMIEMIWIWIWILCLLLCCSSVAAVQQLQEVETSTTSRKLAASNQKPCVKWGNTFDVSLSSKNVIRNCELPDGRPICCSALLNYTKSDPFAKPVGSNYYPSKKDYSGSNGAGKKDENCNIRKVYISSAQELRDLDYSKVISRISDDHKDPKRLEALLKYVLSAETLRNSSKWLDRVKLHMQDEGVKLQHFSNNSLNSGDFHPDDFEFLSRFEVTRECGASVEKWVEWIEPLTITARHPYGFGRCRPVGPFMDATTPRTDRSNVDYVLLQSGKSLHDASYYQNGRRIMYDNAESPMAKRQRYSQVKHFMLDSGTSTFDSSLFWFTCAFAQRKIGFDQVMAWEMTLLEPNDYWRRVPPQWKPFWHFYNVPIQSDLGHADSPIRYLQQLATPADFVAFKLDIDHPAMEMPIALSLLADDRVANLIDEFFFELHFQCEVMTSCGWGKKVPATSHGLKLDRPDILQFFIDLRKKGIRAHIWP